MIPPHRAEDGRNITCNARPISPRIAAASLREASLRQRRQRPRVEKRNDNACVLLIYMTTQRVVIDAIGLARRVIIKVVVDPKRLWRQHVAPRPGINTDRTVVEGDALQRYPQRAQISRLFGIDCPTVDMRLGLRRGEKKMI